MLSAFLAPAFVLAASTASLLTQEAEAKEPPANEPRSFQSEHVGTFNGTRVEYTATVEETILKNDAGDPEASIFTIAYVLRGGEDATRRPVTFLWNGGPGSSSVWLHMGVFGPLRVNVPSDAKDDGGPPYGFEVDDQYTIIGGLSGSWDWKLRGHGRPSYLNVAPYIGKAMRQNSDLQVLVAAGYYDFATPFFGAEYSLNRSGIVSERLHFKYYEAGHMMYVNHTALAKLQRDVRSFLVSVIGRGD